MFYVFSSQGAEARLNATFGSAAHNQPIWLQNVVCSGDERDLADCLGAGESWTLGDCTHAEDVAVICRGNGILFIYDCDLRYENIIRYD